MIPLLFVVSAVYDGLLGLLGLFGTEWFFQTVGVTPPNHPGYVQFPAALLVVFALMFVAVARNPSRNRNLIPYGMLLKVSYAGVVIFHWVAAGLPWVWKPFAIADLVFLLLFGWAYSRLCPPGK
jgi:hypothetical protein